MTDSMVEITYSQPSDLLAWMHSHEIVPADVLERCDFDVRGVPTYSRDVARHMRNRGLGGTLPEHEAGQRYIYGWKTAEALAKRHLGTNPGANKMGRGTIHRECLQALVMAGK